MGDGTLERVRAGLIVKIVRSGGWSVESQVSPPELSNTDKCQSSSPRRLDAAPPDGRRQVQGQGSGTRQGS